MRNIKELIPVIPICAILVVLMTAAIRDDNAKRVFCQNNLKKIYRFTLMYEKDHGGLPPVSVPTKPLWKFWPNYINKYCKEIWLRCIVPLLIVAGSWMFAIWFANILLNIIK